MRKAKTAVGKITEQEKRQQKRALVKQAIKLYDDEQKIIQRSEKKIQTILKSSRYSESKKDELRRDIYKQQQSTIKQLREDARALYDIRRSNIKATSEDRKKEVKRVADYISKQKDSNITYKEAIKKSPRTLEDMSGKKINYDRFPSAKDFKKVRDAGRIGRGLSYRLPVSYSAYTRILKEARKTSYVTRYTLYAIIESHDDNGSAITERVSAMQSTRDIDEENNLTEVDFYLLIDERIEAISEKYKSNNTKCVGLYIEFTVSLK